MTPPPLTLTLRRLATTEADFLARLDTLLAFESETDEQIERSVADILKNVRSQGDTAVLEYTRRFDQLDAHAIKALELPAAELAAAFAALPADQRAALETAAARIRAFHERQKADSWEYAETAAELAGTRLGQKITPLDRVGLYVPGGKASYPSSVLMNALPAKVAGVHELIMVTPTPRGEKNLLVLAAAHLAGVDRVFTIGGAQAVAALAYGTQSIPQVDKIVGPGNAYVAAAKRRVFGTVGIDMVAGPSEILIIADGSANPDWVAMDLFAQAEHDELAQSILLSPDADFIERVAASITRLLPEMPRRNVIATSLTQRGALIHTRSLDEACELANRIAPEHLELAVAEPRALVNHIRHAGAIFIGHYASESLGDYCAGPNHVLPTSRSARFSSPLGVYDFQKRSSLIEVSAPSAARLGSIAATLAHGEGLTAHARAAELRSGLPQPLPPIEWNDDFSVGVAEIDEQHRRLIGILNRLGDCCSKAHVSSAEFAAVCNQVLAELFAYTQEHFADEEAYMEKIGYPALEAHRAQHAAFFEKVAHYTLLDTDTHGRGREIHTYLVQWLTGHILSNDRRFCTFAEQSGKH
jgi:histidinol dehydrogenase